MPHNQTIEERLYGRCVETNDGCWEFTGARSDKGYGHIHYHGRPQLAHRVSWIITHGNIEDDICVLHKCDNPPCCNPNHLFLGTKGDNNTDRNAKGRSSTHNGVNRYNAVLTGEKVREIRLFLNEGFLSQAEIAARYSISQPLVNKIKHFKAWAHVL